MLQALIEFIESFGIKRMHTEFKQFRRQIFQIFQFIHRIRIVPGDFGVQFAVCLIDLLDCRFLEGAARYGLWRMRGGKMDDDRILSKGIFPFLISHIPEPL